MALRWKDGAPECSKCEALLRNPAFAEVFSRPAVSDDIPVGELGSIAMRELERYHENDHRLLPAR